MSVSVEESRIVFELPQESEIFMIEEAYEELKNQDIQSKDFVADFKNVESIDTTFIQLVVSIKKTVKAAENNFVIENVNDDLKHKFALYGCISISESE